MVVAEKVAGCRMTTASAKSPTPGVVTNASHEISFLHPNTYIISFLRTVLHLLHVILWPTGRHWLRMYHAVFAVLLVCVSWFHVISAHFSTSEIGLQVVAKIPRLFSQIRKISVSCETNSGPGANHRQSLPPGGVYLSE